MKSLASDLFDDVPTGVVETLGSLIALYEHSVFTQG